MLNAIQIIAERRISQAISEGTINCEGWKGKPLPIDDDPLIPPDLRMAYKFLKNSGYLPPEVETRKEIHKLEDLIAATEDEHARLKQMKKLSVLQLKLSSMRQRPLQVEEAEYQRKIVEKITLRK